MYKRQEWDQTANNTPEKSLENGNPTKRLSNGEKKDIESRLIQSEIDEMLSSQSQDNLSKPNWLSRKEVKSLDWSEECELEEDSSTSEDHDFETKRRKMVSTKQ